MSVLRPLLTPRLSRLSLLALLSVSILFLTDGLLSLLETMSLLVILLKVVAVAVAVAALLALAAPPALLMRLAILLLLLVPLSLLNWASLSPKETLLTKVLVALGSLT